MPLRTKTVAVAVLVQVPLVHALLLAASVLPVARGFGIPTPPCTTSLVSLSLSLESNDDASAAGVEASWQPIHHVTLEYCTGCRFLTRSVWMAQELFTTFDDKGDASLSAITLTPSRPPPSGKFAVTFQTADTPSRLLWDRHANGQQFPDIKELKQLVRDQIDPARSLGHSDKNPQAAIQQQQQQQEDTLSLPEAPPALPVASSVVLSKIHVPQSHSRHVVIQYCTGCRWMLRSAFFATELLTTLEDDIDALTLIPSRPPEKGGIFVVTVNGKVVWDRSQQGGFPQPKQLKQLVRDMVAPHKSFGHSPVDDPTEDQEDGMDEDEARDMKAFYGVL